LIWNEQQQRQHKTEQDLQKLRKKQKLGRWDRKAASRQLMSESPKYEQK
jgi:hypothetical protein